MNYFLILLVLLILVLIFNAIAAFNGIVNKNQNAYKNDIKLDKDDNTLITHNDDIKD